MYESGDWPFLISFPNHRRDAIFSEPIHYEFSEHQGEWSFPFGVTQEELDNKKWEPAISYLYPLPNFHKLLPDFENLRQLAELIDPLGIVYLIKEEEYFLILKGYGEDFNWEICYAYLECGYLPPYWACRLSNYSGLDYESDKNQEIIFAVLKSLEIGQNMLAVTERSHRYLFMSRLEGYDEDGKFKGYTKQSK